MTTPTDLLLDRVDWRCTICGAKSRTCDCWTECRCGRSYPKGKQCSNPQHAIDAAAEQLAAIVAANVIHSMKQSYPEPMRHASGGFRKTLHARIAAEVRSTLLVVYEENAKAKAGVGR